MRKLLPILLVALLAACGGTKQTTSIPASWSPGASLIYAYPYDGQARIAPTAPIVLQFSTVVSVVGGAPLASAFTLTPDGGSPVAFTLSTTNGGQGVVLTPTAKLAENTHYTIAWTNLTAPDGLIPSVPLSFTTRPAVKGAASSISSSATFQVDRALPMQANFPFMDFSTLRLQFSQPIDVNTLTYGQNVRLEDDTATLVPATVLVSGHLLSIDPRSDLVAGRSYHLKLTNTLKSVLGTTLTPGGYADLVLVPKDSGPRSTMALQVPDSASGTVVSPLTGAAINNVPIASALLGNNSASQQAGNMYAELAFVPHFPDVTPLTMRRGNMLSGSSVDVKIVGTVPTGINTGTIHVNVVSDATGYMVPNPYSKAVDAPRLVYLTMDASMSADNASANGAFTQNLLQIEVVGTAIVKNGKLIMDAVGVTELDVLGLDRASGVLSFHLEGYQDQTTAPAQVADTTPPTLQSWLPGNEAKRARPGDPVILNFTEPLDPNSVNDTNLQLLRNGTAVPISSRVDGAAVVIVPATPLEHNVSYTVAFSNAMTDIAGNGISDATYQRSFSLPALITPTSHSPSVVTTYPGYPCVTTARNVAAGVQGRCAGGLSTDDLLPLPTMPLDRSIQIQFSQSMAAGSIALGATCGTGSFRVERIDATGTCLGTVPGRIEVNPQSLRFIPAAPWTQGTLYRYVLNSNGNGQSATATCDGTQAICGSNGLPLQTQPLAASASTAPTATGGGPLMEIWFTGGARSPWVAQRLRGLPAYDANANFLPDAGEDTAVDTGGGFWRAPNGARVITTAQSGLVTASNIGCAPGSSCPQNQFLYMTTALDAEVADYDATSGGVRVLIQPSQILASSFTVYANTAFGNTTAPTGEQIFRLRYALNTANGKRELPITGIITFQNGSLQLTGSLDLYLDEPQLAPSVAGVPISHNLHSYPLSLTVSGPVYFLPDGRMLATLANTGNVDFTVNLSSATLPAGSITLRIPQGTMYLEGVSQPIKP